MIPIIKAAPVVAHSMHPARSMYGFIYLFISTSFAGGSEAICAG